MANHTEADGRSASADGDLLPRLRAGDREAVAALYHRYADRLRRLAHGRCEPALASRFDADDIVQSVFRALLSGLDVKLYTAPDGADLWRWLVAVALNKLRARAAFHRAACRDARQTRGSDALWQVAESRPAAANDTTFLDLSLRETLDRLPRPLRDVVGLRLAGHEVAEVARQLGRSKRTVERLLQECRQELRNYLTFGMEGAADDTPTPRALAPGPP